MKALIVNCSPVKTGATAEIASIIEKEISTRYDTKCICIDDYSDGMIAEARKGESPANLTFEIADAMDLPYSDHSFDAVLIANVLYIVPDPEKVLKEIDRVLRPGGILIAPNFVEHKGTFISRIWSGILNIGESVSNTSGPRRSTCSFWKTTAGM